MIRVLHLVGSTSPTSIPVDIARATNQLESIESTVLAFLQSSTTGVYDTPVLALGARSRFDIRAYRRLRDVIEQCNIDILHTHDNFLGSVGRVVAATTDVAVVDSEQRQHTAHSPLQNAVNVPTLPLADAVVPNSVQTRDSFLRSEEILLDESNISVIYNGVDFDRISAAGDENSDDGGDELRMITVARLIDIKNHRTTLESFARVKESHEHAELVLVGDGPLRSELEAFANDLGIDSDVQFLGEVERAEVYRQMQQSDLFVLFSRSEGFCLAAVEAMASGLPVVVSDIDVLHEVVGDVGCYADPDDTDAVATAINDLIEDADQMTALGEEARERAEQQFSLERTAQEYQELYAELVDESHDD